MECYYLDARTSDTICSYQVQTPQLKYITLKIEVTGYNGAWGVWITKMENKGSLSHSEQSNELDI